MTFELVFVLRDVKCSHVIPRLFQKSPPEKRNPLLIFKFDKTKFKTTKKRESVNPEWTRFTRKFKCKVSKFRDLKSLHLTIELYDWIGPSEPNDLIGVSEIDFYTLCTGSSRNIFPLQNIVDPNNSDVKTPREEVGKVYFALEVTQKTDVRIHMRNIKINVLERDDITRGHLYVHNNFENNKLMLIDKVRGNDPENPDLFVWERACVVLNKMTLPKLREERVYIQFRNTSTDEVVGSSVLIMKKYILLQNDENDDENDCEDDDSSDDEGEIFELNGLLKNDRGEKIGDMFVELEIENCPRLTQLKGGLNTSAFSYGLKYLEDSHVPENYIGKREDVENLLLEQKKEKTMSLERRKLFTVPQPVLETFVTVDFGTTHTGFGYCSRECRSLETITVHDDWGEDSTQMFKNRTMILYQDDEPLYWGIKAEQKYYEYLEQDDADDLYLLTNFKMILSLSSGVGDEHEEDEEFDDLYSSTIEIRGKVFSILKIMTDYLTMIRDDIVEYVLENNNLANEPKNVKWVLSIPALWTEREKLIYREAARQAGIINEFYDDAMHFEMGLESESGCIPCLVEMQKSIGDEQDLDDEIGKKFVVVDAGGGTVDFTVYLISKPVDEDDIIGLKQLSKSCSIQKGGGNQINRRIEHFVISRLTKDGNVRKKFAAALRNSFEYTLFCSEIEKMKIQFDMQQQDDDDDEEDDDDDEEKTEEFSIALPPSLSEIFQKFEHPLYYEEEETIGIPAISIKKRFYKVLHRITKPLKKLVSEKDVDYVFLVGGFAESNLFYKLITRALEEFSEKTKIIRPENAGNKVIVGSTWLSKNPSIVTHRITCMAYGMKISRPIAYSNDLNGGEVPVKRNEAKEFEYLGRKYEKDVFDKLVGDGESVENGEVVERHFCVTSRAHSSSSDDVLEIEIFGTTEENDIYYVDDSGVIPVMTVRTQIRDVFRNEIITAKIIFGKTEVSCEVVCCGQILETVCTKFVQQKSDDDEEEDSDGSVEEEYDMSYDHENVNLVNIEDENLGFPVVVELGSCIIRCGVGGKINPKYSFRSVLGRIRSPYNSTNGGVIVDGVLRSYFVGDEINGKESFLEFIKPIKRGRVRSLADVELFFEYIFFHLFRIDPAKHPLIVADSANEDVDDDEVLAGYLSERFNLPAIYIEKKPILALFSQRSSLNQLNNGIVVDCGHEQTCVVPIVEGKIQNEKIKKVGIGGKTITRVLTRMLESNEKIEGRFPLSVVENIKKTCCYVSVDDATKESERSEYILYEDGNFGPIYVHRSRYLAPEQFFFSQINLPKMILECVDEFDDLSSRKEILKTVILCGGNSQFDGLAERIEYELTKSVRQREEEEVVVVEEEGVQKRINVMGNEITDEWKFASVLSVAKQFRGWVTKGQMDNLGELIMKNIQNNKYLDSPKKKKKRAKIESEEEDETPRMEEEEKGEAEKVEEEKELEEEKGETENVEEEKELEVVRKDICDFVVSYDEIQFHGEGTRDYALICLEFGFLYVPKDNDTPQSVQKQSTTNSKEDTKDTQQPKKKKRSLSKWNIFKKKKH